MIDSSTAIYALGVIVAEGTDLGSQLSDLEGSGLFLLVLPFLLVFAIVYGLLTSLGLFGEEKVNVIIALVIAAFAALFFPMGQWLAFLEGPWAMWLVLILMVMITLALAGFNPTQNQNMRRVIGAIALIGVIMLFLTEDPEAGGNVLDAIFGQGASEVGLASIPIIGPVLADLGWPLIIMLILIIGLIYWVQD